MNRIRLMAGKCAQKKPLDAAIFSPGATIEAWDRFFCATCQMERPIAIRVRFGRNRMPRCEICVAKREAVKRGAGRKPNPRHYAEDLEMPIETHIPDSVVAAYDESRE